MYLSFNHNLEVMKNTTYLENVFSLMQWHIFSLSQIGYFSLYHEKIAFCLKRGVFLGLEIGWFFFSYEIREKGVFFKHGHERGIRFGQESVCVCVGWEWGGGGGVQWRPTSAMATAITVPAVNKENIKAPYYWRSESFGDQWILLTKGW